MKLSYCSCLMCFFLCFTTLVDFKCVNDSVVYKPTTSNYRIHIEVFDSISGTTLDSSSLIFPGQTVILKGCLTGDSTFIQPLWTVESSRINRYRINYSFNNPGTYPLIFMIRDSAGFELADTHYITIQKIDSALIYGKAYLYGSKDFRTIRVLFIDKNTKDTVRSLFADSSGMYVNKGRITPGHYTLIVEDTASSYLYNRSTIDLTVYPGRLNLLPETTLFWTYALTRFNMITRNDTLIAPENTVHFPVKITDMHDSKLKVTSFLNPTELLTSSKGDTAFEQTFKSEGLNTVRIVAVDSSHGTNRTDSVQVFVTSGKRYIIQRRDSVNIVVNNTVLFVSGRSRLSDNVNCFFWDFNGDGQFEKDSSLSGNALYTFPIAGNYNVICRSLLNNGHYAADTFKVNVLPNRVINQYAFTLKVTDAFSKQLITDGQDIEAGSELSFSVEFSKGDTTKIKPQWRFFQTNDSVNAFSFKRVLTDTGLTKVIFSISDSTGADLRDTFTVDIFNIKGGGAISGKAFFGDRTTHKGINIRVLHGAVIVSETYSDTTGLYFSSNGIPEGKYTVAFTDTAENSEYTPDTVYGVEIKKGVRLFLEPVVLKDRKAPQIHNKSPSSIIFNDTLSFAVTFVDNGAGLNDSTIRLFINDTLIPSTNYSFKNSQLQYVSMQINGNYFVKAIINDRSGNTASTVNWLFSVFDTTKILALKPDDNKELSIYDSVLFLPEQNWLNKEHRFQIEIGNRILLDSMTVYNMKYVFDTAGVYSIGFREFDKGNQVGYRTAVITIEQDRPVISINGDTLVDLDTSGLLSVHITQRFGSIVLREWKLNDSVLTGALSDTLIIRNSLPFKNLLYKFRCRDDDGNESIDSFAVSFGRWVYGGNRGFTDSSRGFNAALCNGTPFVACRILSKRNEEKLICKYLSGNTWNYSGDTVAENIFSFSMGSQGNYPVIAFGDYNGTYDSVKVITFDGIKWNYETNLNCNLNPNVYDSKSISVKTFSTTTWIAMVRRTDLSGYLLVKDGEGWNLVSQPFYNGTTCKVNIDNLQNTPIISFMDSTNQRKLFVKKFENGQWSSLGTGAVLESIQDYSFCINNSVPYAAGVDLNSNLLTVKKYESSQWKSIDVYPEIKVNQVILSSFRNQLFMVYSESENSSKLQSKMLYNGKWIDLNNSPDNYAYEASLVSDIDRLYIIYKDKVYRGGLSALLLK